MDDYVVRNKETFDRLGSAATDEDELIRVARRGLPAFQMVLAGSRVLDLGCGVGHDSRKLKLSNLDVQGLDISEAMLAEAKRQVEGVPFLQGDFRALPFADESFDGVWANGSLFYVTPDDLLKTLAEVHRILKPAGVIFASYLQGEGASYNDSLYRHKYTYEQLETLYQQAGFKTIDRSYATQEDKYLMTLAVK